jgi:alkylated DNA nucleotide flippase Atl1
MVQLKYFGDSRDFFKYDLISFVLSKNIFSSYCFVPMLTEHRNDREGDKTPKPSPCKSSKLLSYIKKWKNSDLNHWERWLKQFISVYRTIQPINKTLFTDLGRTKYWEKFKEILASDNALVFFDPDTGLQAGRTSYIDKPDKEKYILNEDLFNLFLNLSNSSMYIFYQHLQWNTKKHVEDIERKTKVLESSDPRLLIAIYYENDLAFVFATKNIFIYDKINKALDDYHSKSTIIHRGVHRNSSYRGNSTPKGEEMNWDELLAFLQLNVPAGQVTTYGNLSKVFFGGPGSGPAIAANLKGAVGNDPANYPWANRVVNANGEMLVDGQSEQLRNEGIPIRQNGTVDFNKQPPLDWPDKPDKPDEPDEPDEPPVDGDTAFEIFQDIINQESKGSEDLLNILHKGPYERGSFANKIKYHLEMKLKDFFNQKNTTLFNLIQSAEAANLMQDNAIDLAHIIRKQRNQIIYNNVPPETYHARNRLVLIAAFLLWPQLP